MWQRRGQPTARSDRWRREDDQPRLLDAVPALASLRLELEEQQGGHPVAGTRRAQPIVVRRAAASFEIPCGSQYCKEGGHDLSRPILEALRAQRGRAAGTSTCRGYVAQHACGRELLYRIEASYGETGDDSSTR